MDKQKKYILLALLIVDIIVVSFYYYFRNQTSRLPAKNQTTVIQTQPSPSPVLNQPFKVVPLTLSSTTNTLLKSSKSKDFLPVDVIVQSDDTPVFFAAIILTYDKSKFRLHDLKTNDAYSSSASAIDPKLGVITLNLLYMNKAETAPKGNIKLASFKLEAIASGPAQISLQSYDFGGYNSNKSTKNSRLGLTFAPVTYSIN